MKIHLLSLAVAIVAVSACSEPEQTAKTAPAPTPAPTAARAPATAPVVADGTRTQDAQGRRDATGAGATTQPTVPPPESSRTQGEDGKLTVTGGTSNGTGPTPTTTTQPGQRGDQSVAAAADPSLPATAEPSFADAAPVTAPGTVAPNSANTEKPLLPDRDAEARRAAANHPADDTGRNQREDGSLPTPLDQGENAKDRNITLAIRQAVVARDDLSLNAKNVKVITRDGVVTLRGPVASARERDTIGSAALNQDGVKRVDNLLEPVQQ